MVLRGLMTEQDDGSFTCSVIVPAEDVVAFLAGTAVAVTRKPSPQIKVSWADEIAGPDLIPSEPPADKPSTQTVATIGEDTALVRPDGGVSNRQHPVMEALHKWSQYRPFATWLRDKINGSEFDGASHTAYQHIIAHFRGKHPAQCMAFLQSLIAEFHAAKPDGGSP